MLVKLNSQLFRLQGWWNKVSNLHWMTIQGYSAPKSFRSTAWRRLLAQRRPILEESTCGVSKSVLAVGERHNTRLVEDEWATQPAKTSDKPWTGWTNFEKHQDFPTQLESDDEEQQQGTKAQAVQAPKQPTPQETLEHNVTHLSYRSWCPICVHARGRQNNRPKQHSKLPIIQLDFGYIKGFDDNNVHPILTAIDIQSGMIMATQLTDKRMLFDYAVTQLQHFFIECRRTSHTFLQSDQEDFLTALATAVANRIGNITTRNSGAYFTITRRSRASTQNTVCTNQNIQGTNQAELQQRHFNETFTHALDSLTQRMHHEQVCSSQQWMHELLQQMQQRAQRTTL